MNEVTIIDPKEYGLEEKQAESIISKLNQIVLERVELFEEYERVIELDVNQTDSDVFKRVRLSISDNRTKQLEPARKADKELFLRGGQFVDASYNSEITENKRREAVLLEKEKHFERIEFARIEKQTNDRQEMLAPYSEFVPFGISFGIMNEEEFQKLFNLAKLGFETKVAEEKRIEQERLEAEKKEQERIAEERRLESERIEAQRIENEKLKQEAEKAEAERKKQAEIQAKKDAEIQAKLDAERKENERIQAELNAKREAEVKAEKEKAEAERLAKLQAEKDAKAPIKQKLSVWVDSFDINKTWIDTDNAVAKEIIAKFEAFKDWSKNQIENL